MKPILEGILTAGMGLFIAYALNAGELVLLALFLIAVQIQSEHHGRKS